MEIFVIIFGAIFCVFACVSVVMHYVGSPVVDLEMFFQVNDEIEREELELLKLEQEEFDGVGIA
jgi:hypothetical protein